MPTSINNYLKDLSYRFFLNPNSDELQRINTSINNLFNNLDRELGILINRKFIFGSYDRRTILPRSIDEGSDIDIMVIFNHTDYERTPETYRNWLKNFADKHYKNRYGSDVVKSFPTVTISLNNIKYDLVPAKEDGSSFTGKTIYIPDKNSGWRETDPLDVKQKLTNANTKYNSIVKPIVRLMKSWNCSNGYPYDSYALELEITDMNFHGDTIESGFFYAIDQLKTSTFDPQSKTNKISSLRFNINKVRENLNNYDTERAKQWLHRVLPY